MESISLDFRATHVASTGTDGAAETVGNTPLLGIVLVIAGCPREVYLKLEGANPTGSMKDRTGYALLQDLSEQGKLHADSVIVESTSGNLGIALAAFCQQRHLRFIAVVDPKTTAENLCRLEAFGAQLDMVRESDATGGYLLSRLARVQSLCEQHPDYLWTDQYANPANPRIHYQTTGPELYRQMEEQLEAVFVPASTGGTLAGIGRYLREVSPTTRIIGVDACGSVIFGTPAAPRRLTGIGSSRPSNFLTRELYDTYLLVRDEEAFAFCQAIRASTGLLLGGSSGATLAACARYLAAFPELRRVACICADDGNNYASSIFSEQWLCQQRVCLTPADLGPVQAILKGDGRER